MAFTFGRGAGASTSRGLSGADGAAVGKRTLVEQLAAPVQRKAEHGAAEAMLQDPAWVGGAATLGTSGTATALPHLDLIQRAFGRHEVGGIRAYVGGPASDGATQMGARAYATGDQIAFAAPPDLHTAAHEAAHVVQQRQGVVAAAVGREGDGHERDADAVADAVVRGQSAEALLGAASPSAAATPGKQAPVQRVLDAGLVTAMGELFEKAVLDGHLEKKQMAVIDRLRLIQIDNSPEIARAVKFLFSELDPGKSELLRQALFARGGQATQLALDRTIEQIEHYTLLGDNPSVAWFTTTTPQALQARLVANHGQPALPTSQAQPPPPAGQAMNQATLEQTFQAHRAQPANNHTTQDVAVQGVGTNNQVTVRIGHFQRRHTFQSFHFGPDNIFKGNFDLTCPHGLFAPGTNVMALATQLVQSPAIISSLQAAMSDQAATWWSGSEGGNWFAFEFAQRNAVTLVQLYSLAGIRTTLGDLKTTGINRGYDDYANHQEHNNPQPYAPLNGQAGIQPTSREQFGNNREIEHWDDPSGTQRHTDWRRQQGQWNQSGGWRMDQPQGQQGQPQPAPQLMQGQWSPQGTQWVPRLDDGVLFGQLDQNTHQVEYRGERQAPQGGREFLAPNPNPQPTDWRGISVTQPNGGAQVEVTDLQTQAVESGRRIQTDGAVSQWDAHTQTWVADPGTEATHQAGAIAAWIAWAETDAAAHPNAQQPSQVNGGNAPPVAMTAFTDCSAGVQDAIQAPGQQPQGSPSRRRGYQAGLALYRQGEAALRQAYQGGNANPQPAQQHPAYMAGWNDYAGGWAAAAQNPDAQAPGNVQDTGFHDYVQSYDAGVAAAQLAGAQGNANSQDPAHLTGWADFVVGWNDAHQSPLAQGPQHQTRGGVRGFACYRLQHPPPPVQAPVLPPQNQGGPGNQGGLGGQGTKRKFDDLNA